jgi:GDPmannose 4,6-dehydratase
MVKLAFITGITGQDGSYLSELLIEKGYEIHGIVRRTSLLFTTKRIEHIRDKIELHYGDLTDGSALTQLLHKITKNKEIERFEIYNLGAQSHVQVSFEIPEYTSLVDGIGVLKILEAIRSLPDKIKDKTRFYQAGTSEMFGDVLEKPQTETTPFRPQSPYACAKVYAHFLVRNYRESYNMFACNGILFNHESPRRGHNFVTMKIVKAVKNIVDNKQKTLRLGNIYSTRDWGHAKDYVYGMWLMLQQDKPDDYVLATNKTTKVKEFVNKCFKYKNINLEWKGEGLNEVAINKDTGKIVVEIDEKYFRPSEVEYLLGSSEKAQNILGWKAITDLDGLIEDMFNN